MTKIDAYFSRLASAEKPMALATVIQAVSPTSAKAGDKALIDSEKIVEGWIGGGCAQPAVIKATKNVLSTREPSIIRVSPKGEWEALEGVVDFGSSCLSGGTLVIFIEPINQRSSLCVLGQSPVAISLALLAEQLDFSVTLAGAPLDVATSSNSNVNNVNIVPDFSVRDDVDFVVIATQGKRDRIAIEAALASQASYISMVASAKKIAGLKLMLEESKVAPELIDRIHGPAGIEIGAETPDEIAVSILADLIRERRLNNARKGDVKEVQAAKPATKPVTETHSTEQKSSGGCCGS